MGIGRVHLGRGHLVSVLFRLPHINLYIVGRPILVSRAYYDLHWQYSLGRAYYLGQLYNKPSQVLVMLPLLY